MASGSSYGMVDDARFDNFCHLLIEDYLRRKNMQETLYHFREEWGDLRPPEDESILSWYEIAMKLRLPEIINEGSGHLSVIENLTGALIRESSLRARRGVEVTVQGLCDMPKVRPLPAVMKSIGALQQIQNSQPYSPENSQSQGSVVPASSRDSFLMPTSEEHELEDEIGNITPLDRDSTSRSPSLLSGNSKDRASLHSKKAPTAAVAAALEQKKAKLEAKAKLAAEVAGGKKFISRAGQRVVLSGEAEQIVKAEVEKQEELMLKLNARKIKPSNENWIPDLERSRSLARDFGVLKANLTDIQKREMQERREMKQFLVSDLEKARNAESLGQTHRHACGCCLQKFLPLNLPLRVSQKAVLDIRIKWGGNLTSKTVFGGINPPIGQYLAGTEVAPDGTILNPEGTFNASKLEDFMAASSASNTLAQKDPAKKSYIEKIQERLSRMPRCYSDVPICTFCSQFFQNQADYRPSYSDITFQERKSKHMTMVAKEKELWDPLKLVEKDREEAIAAEEEMNRMLLQELQESGGIAGGLGEGNSGTGDDFTSP